MLTKLRASNVQATFIFSEINEINEMPINAATTLLPDKIKKVSK